MDNSNPYTRLPIKFITFIILFGGYVLILNSKGIYENDIVYLSNALIVLYAIYHILANEDRAYSAKKTFYLFILFFMGIAPILQYKNGDQTVGGYDIHEYTYIVINIILFFILIFFDIFYYIFYKYGKFNRVKKIFIDQSIDFEHKEKSKIRILLILISLFSLICTLLFFKDKPYLLFIRGLGGESTEGVESGNFLSPLMDSFIRPLSVVVCINYFCIGKSKRVKSLLFLLMLITCFPTSLSRLRTAAYYLPFLIIIFPNLRWRNKYTVMFSFGLLFIFPLLNSFRNWNGLKELELDFEMFRTMHFDSYQSFAFVFQNDIITYGKQLLLVFFFWVPRSLWESKPYMSGKMVADEYGLWFNQISMNYWGEGYLNAGIVGVFLFTIVLAYLTVMFDKLYWQYNNANVKTLFAPFFLFFIGIYFFFMRGDLMFGFQYTIMLLFANYIVFKLIKKFY